MKILEHNSEATFETSFVEFSDEHYEIAKKIHSQYDCGDSSKCTPLMVSEDKKSLVFSVNLADRIKDRLAYVCGVNRYIIRIENV